MTNLALKMIFWVVIIKILAQVLITGPMERSGREQCFVDPVCKAIQETR